MFTYNQLRKKLCRRSKHSFIFLHQLIFKPSFILACTWLNQNLQRTQSSQQVFVCLFLSKMKYSYTFKNCYICAKAFPKICTISRLPHQIILKRKKPTPTTTNFQQRFISVIKLIWQYIMLVYSTTSIAKANTRLEQNH